MSTNTNKNPAKQKHDAINAKRLIAAASITLTIGGAVGFLGEQLATPASVAVEQADAYSFTVTYMTPVAQATATAVEITDASAAALATEPAATMAATTEPTAVPTAVPTVEPTTEPTVAPTAAQTVVSQQPAIVAQSRSSR